MSAARAKDYVTRAVYYMDQRGVVIDEHTLYYKQVTPKQRRRLFKKERRSWRRGFTTGRAY